jgi:anti-anti-sigma regulatory factor
MVGPVMKRWVTSLKWRFAELGLPLPEASGVAIDVEVVEGVVTLLPRGKLTEQPLAGTLERLMREGHRRLTFDLKMADLDSDAFGCGELVQAHTFVAERGGTLQLRHVPKRLADLLAAMKLNQFPFLIDDGSEEDPPAEIAVRQKPRKPLNESGTTVPIPLEPDLDEQRGWEMKLWGFRKTDLTDNQFRDTLFELVAKHKTDTLKTFIGEHHARLQTLFPTWKVVPPEIRDVAERTKWWVEGMIGIASASAELGDRSFFALLQGHPRDNTLILWREALVAGQAAVDRGNHAEAIRILEDALKFGDGIIGTALDAYMPKHYGLLGHAYFLAGNLESARTHTIKARNYCERMNDREGVAIYTSNLARIDSRLRKKNPSE